MGSPTLGSAGDVARSLCETCTGVDVALRLPLSADAAPCRRPDVMGPDPEGGEWHGHEPMHAAHRSGTVRRPGRLCGLSHAFEAAGLSSRPRKLHVLGDEHLWMLRLTTDLWAGLRYEF